MKSKMLAFLSLALVLAMAPPPAGATHNLGVCGNAHMHDYAGSMGFVFEPGTGDLTVSHVDAHDSCADPLFTPIPDFSPAAWAPGGANPILRLGTGTADPGYDGDPDQGFGGGAFPAGQGCAPPNAHHAYGPGATYWASDDTGIATVAYWAGTDGPVDPTVDPCLGDGMVTSDPLLSPYDCGRGDLGHYAPPVWTPATLGPNTPSATCDPADGYVWLWTPSGLVTVGGVTYVSTPIAGHAWG